MSESAESGEQSTQHVGSLGVPDHGGDHVGGDPTTAVAQANPQLGMVENSFGIHAQDTVKASSGSIVDQPSVDVINTVEKNATAAGSDDSGSGKSVKNVVHGCAWILIGSLKWLGTEHNFYQVQVARDLRQH